MDEQDTRNAFGVNTWVWVSPLTDERLAALAPRVKSMGFDVIELPIEDPDDWDEGRSAELLAELGLGATTCAVMPATRDLVADDPAVVAETQAYLRRCVRMAARVGAPLGLYTDSVIEPDSIPVRVTMKSNIRLGPAMTHTVATVVEALTPPSSTDDRFERNWVCQICGHNFEGDQPPEVCPICGVGRDQFLVA